MTATAPLLDPQPPEVAPAPARLRLVVRPAPRREPPFDDELGDLAPPAAWNQPLPFPAPPRVPAASLPPRPDTLPQPGPWTRRLLVGLIESADGRRAVQQLSPLLGFAITRALGADFERAAESGTRHWLHRASVQSVRSTEPAAGVAELCATLRVGERIRAVAVRLEATGDRWRCTRLQLG